MKLPKLSQDEISSLFSPDKIESRDLAECIRAHLVSGLPAHAQVTVREALLPVQAINGDQPRLHADHDLRAAWMAARFGSTGVCSEVPTHYGESLLAKIKLALAKTVLRKKLAEASSLCLEIQLNDQSGMLQIDWSDMSAAALMAWALTQWTTT
jgi:hypothetical protein